MIFPTWQNLPPPEWQASLRRGLRGAIKHPPVSRPDYQSPTQGRFSVQYWLSPTLNNCSLTIPQCELSGLAPGVTGRPLPPWWWAPTMPGRDWVAPQPKRRTGTFLPPLHVPCLKVGLDISGCSPDTHSILYTEGDTPFPTLFVQCLYLYPPLTS